MRANCGNGMVDRAKPQSLFAKMEAAKKENAAAAAAVGKEEGSEGGS